MIKSIKIFSLVSNFNKWTTGKKVVNMDKLVYHVQYDKQAGYVKSKCVDICSFINSNHFSYLDVKMFLLYTHLFTNKKVHLNVLNRDDILNVKKLFSEKQYQNDKDFITAVCKKQKITNIKELFEIHADGESFIYGLIINKYVSPLFYINMCTYVEIPNDVNETDEHRHFKKILDLMIENLK